MDTDPAPDLFGRIDATSNLSGADGLASFWPLTTRPGVTSAAIARLPNSKWWLIGMPRVNLWMLDAPTTYLLPGGQQNARLMPAHH
jgi:hypothetical protein